MHGQDDLIDLTESPEASPIPAAWRRRARSATLDITSPAGSEVQVVDLSRAVQRNEAGPSNHMQPTVLDEADGSGSAAAAEPDLLTSGKSIGKRKRLVPAQHAGQAKPKKPDVHVSKAEAKAHKDEARASKKARMAAEQKAKQEQQKRVDQFGKTVRYASTAAQQTKERMARAMPSVLSSLSTVLLQQKITCLNTTMCDHST